MSFNIKYLDKVINAITSASDYDFSLYSAKSLYRRTESFVNEFNLSTDELIDSLKEDKMFLETFVKYVTINTTAFYRDAVTWQLYDEHLHKYFINKNNINIWHIGCSIGFEVYSNLILLHNCGILSKSKVYATDINSDVLETAKKGKYKYLNTYELKSNYYNAISKIQNGKNLAIENYFNIDEDDNSMQVKNLLLNKVIFKKHDILSETNPFNVKFDIIFARNILIYFKHKVQERLYNFFYRNLKYGGYFIIGRYEAIISDISKKFSRQDVIYKKLVP